MSTLMLRLAGPMQSWGNSSRFDERRTGREPSRSGIIGMIASAMGMSREADLGIFKQLKIGIRVDQEGKLLRDYHTAHGKSAYITNRYYLCDAIFVVAIEGEEDFVKKIHKAMMYPKNPLFLGRRSCPPSFPVVLGIRDKDLFSSLKEENYQVMKKSKVRFILECEVDDDGTVIRDVPLSFDPSCRTYVYRKTREETIIIGSVTEHDVMAELGGE